MAPIHYFDMLLISIVFFVLAVVFLRHRRRLPITNWPFIGMTPDLLLNIHRIHDYATHILKLSDGTLTFKGPWFANIDMLVTSDPANIHHMLSKNFHNYPKGPEFRNMFDILGDGIFNSDHELWEVHRKTTMSLLKHPEFITLLETNTKNKVEKGLLPLLNFVSSHNQETDLQDIFQRFTFDAICVLLLDYDPESLCIDLPFVPCEKAFADAEEALLWRHILPKRVWKLQKRFGLGKEKKLSDAWKVFDEFIYNCLDLKDENKEKEKLGVLTSLMRGFEGQRGTYGDSRKFIKDTILNLMIAGRDTTSTALSWFFYLLAQNPKVEKNIRDEIKKHLGGRKWESLSVKELGELVYLHGGISEALRLYPPVAFEHKSPSSGDVLPSGHTVDKHTRIILSFYSMGRMEGIWGKDCMEFRPERWISDGGGIKHEPSYKFTAFHAGPRTCLGKEMVFIQMKMVATSIIYHYHVELVEGHEVCASDSILLQMKYGLKGAFKVFSGCKGIEHPVTSIGYGTTEEKEDYWLIKNSWSLEWREGGFILKAITTDAAMELVRGAATVVFCLLFISGRVLARSFHAVLNVCTEMIKQALGSGDGNNPESPPELSIEYGTSSDAGTCACSCSSN